MADRAAKLERAGMGEELASDPGNKQEVELAGVNV